MKIQINKLRKVEKMTFTSLMEINKSGKSFNGYALVKSVQEATANNGSPYFTIVIGEKSKTIGCKLWERHFNGNTTHQLKNDIFKVGTILHIEGSVSEYRGELQMAIVNYRLTEEEEVDIANYLEAAPEPIDLMINEYEQFLNYIKSPILRTICMDIYNEHKSAFITFPAGKSNHHAFRSGLIYHSLSMLRISKHICSQYKQINRDLVYAGIALHDLGKVVELTGFLAPDYTKVGNLLGHITIVNMFIDRKAQKLKEEKDKFTKEDFNQVYELMHVISAHHGKLEYGSPVVPKTLEAEVVHQIDMLDSRINMVINGLSDDKLSTEEPKKIFPLGLFYKSSTQQE